MHLDRHPPGLRKWPDTLQCRGFEVGVSATVQRAYGRLPKLEFGFGVVCAGFPSSLVKPLGLEASHALTFWLLLYLVPST